MATPAVIAGATSRASAATEPVVEITSGKIRGLTANGVMSFRGVPYGAPTSGKNRFMPPRKPAPWANVRDAVTWAGRAPQGAAMKQRPELSGLSGPPDALEPSEDCLTLNVWTQRLGSTTKRPVMVWYHGGAFATGSANQPRLDGTNLVAKQDVVVVSVNQRLNILGHLHLAELGGPEFANSGNSGTLDMVAALHWVRDNIERFGGDPANVTIFGHSGGGGKVSTLMAMPSAKGLFHRAIIMSGAVIRVRERERAAKLTEAVLAELGLDRNKLGELQELPFQKLLAAIPGAQKRLGPSPHPLLDRYDFGPLVDGTVLPAHPFEPKASELSRDIPLIVGGVKDEMAIYLAPDDEIWNRTLSEADYKTRVAKVTGEGADRIIEAYTRLYPGMGSAERLITTLTHSHFGMRTMLLAERKAAQGGAPVWLYSFDWETPVHGGKLKSYHALDVPFAFDTIDNVGATDKSSAAHELAKRVSSTWATFARTGRPDNATIPSWQPFTLADRTTMVFDRKCSPLTNHKLEEHRLWKEVVRVS